MALTRQDIVDEALEDSFDETKYASLAARWLNEGVGRICRRVPALARDARLTIATVAGTADYTLPSAVVRIDSVLDDQGERLDEISPEEFAELANGSARGRPLAFTLRSSATGTTSPVTVTPALSLWPTPSAVLNLTVRHQQRSAELDDGTDPIPLPDDYAHLLVMWIRSRSFAKEDDFEASAWWRQQFETELREMRADLVRPTGTRKHRTPSMFDMGFMRGRERP